MIRIAIAIGSILAVLGLILVLVVMGLAGGWLLFELADFLESL